MAHHFKVDASLHFSPSPRNIRTLQKMGCANIPFRETIVARKLERIWKMKKWTAIFFDRPSLCAS